jgi:hypothetical protein
MKELMGAPSSPQPAPKTEDGQAATTTAAAAPVVSPAAPTKKAEPHAVYIKDVNLADGERVEEGSFLIKSWKLRNAGEEAWPEGTKVIFSRGDRLLPDGTEEFALPPVQPGEEVTVSVPLQMPQKPGKVVSHFQLATPDRTVFGPRFWAQLHVGPAVEEAKQAKQEASSVPLDSLAPMRAAAASASASSSATGTGPEPQADDDDGDDSEDGRVEEVGGDNDSDDEYHLVEASSAPVEPNPPVVSDCPPITAEGGLGESKHKEQVEAAAPEAAAAADVDDEDEVVDEEVRELTAKYGSQLAALARMGFTNTVLNGYLLNKHNGNVETVITWLLRLSQ